MKKSLISAAVAAALTAAVSAPAQAVIINMDFDGLFTMLGKGGAATVNSAKPYSYDAAWGYGNRSQVTGTMSFNTDTGAGTGTIQPFAFFDGFGNAVAAHVDFQAIGDGAGGPGSLILGNMLFSWNMSDIATQIVLDASGFFNQIGGIIGGSVTELGSQPSTLASNGFAGPLVADTCAVNLDCATPASNGALKGGKWPIGPVPIATTDWNVSGGNGDNTSLLYTDDAGVHAGNYDTVPGGPASVLAFNAVADVTSIAGAPMDNGPFADSNASFDITSAYNISVVPVPAAVWLFGSGLLGLVGIARRRKQV